jgi:hypothetical protein
MAGGVIVAALTAMVFIYARGLFPGGVVEPYLPANGVLAALPETVNKTPDVEVESARLRSSLESLFFNNTARVWNVHIVLRNTGSLPLVFGDRWLLFEANSDGSSFDGAVMQRAGARYLLPKYFGVSEW